MNSKNIAIDDAIGRFRIVNYGVVSTPLHKLRLTAEQTHVIMNTFRGPKFVYAIDPNDDHHRIRLTEENYMLSEDELFGKKEPVVTEVIPEVVNLETETMTLDDLPTPEVAEEPKTIEVNLVITEEPVITEVNPVITEEPVITEVNPVIVEEPKIVEIEPVIIKPIEEVKETEKVSVEVEEDDDFDDLKPATTETEESKSVVEPVMKESERQNNQPKQNNNQPKKKYTYNGNNNNYHHNNNYNKH